MGLDQQENNMEQTKETLNIVLAKLKKLGYKCINKSEIEFNMIFVKEFNKDIKQCIQISEENAYYVSLSTNIIFRGDLTDIQIALNRVEDDFKGLR